MFAQTYPAYNINFCTSGSKGYYFLDPFTISQFTTGNPTQMIIDSTGQTIYYRPLSNGGGDFKIQPNGGLMSYLYNNKFFLMDSTFTVVDSVACIGHTTDGHDLQVLPNGDFLLLGLENINMNLSSYNFFGPSHTSPGNANATVKCGIIQEQNAAHQVVFEWHTKDHFAFADVDSSWLYAPNIVDWTHCNAVELDDDGNILLSMRHFDEITKINRSDSSVIWRMGGNANQFTFTNDPQMFKGQHDIRRIDNGHLTLWDNGQSSPLHMGTAKEYELDETNHIATLDWSYVESPNSYSIAVGDVQRLPNGNTLIDYGVTSHEPRLFDVVDPSGNIVFEIQFADTLRSYRAFNYQTMPWQLPRPEITCVRIGNQNFLDAGPGYSSYQWSTGATTEMIPVTTTDTFTVFVPIGQGGFIRSLDFIVVDTAAPCGPLAVQPETQENEFTFHMFPNPVNDELHIQFDKNPAEGSVLEIFDAIGELVYSEKMNSSSADVIIPTTDFASGIYLVRVNGASGKFVK
jgi:hypothetical protein